MERDSTVYSVVFPCLSIWRSLSLQRYPSWITAKKCYFIFLPARLMTIVTEYLPLTYLLGTKPNLWLISNNYKEGNGDISFFYLYFLLIVWYYINISCFSYSLDRGTHFLREINYNPHICKATFKAFSPYFIWSSELFAYVNMSNPILLLRKLSLREMKWLA